ncbi:MAG: HAD family phosphatase [Planctomycetes bacterium]|nr:HAD family phosphatase [Planctomycetota bacterium]
MTRIDAILFDLDGTLIDSEPFHLEAWNRVLAHFGHVPPSPHWNDDTIGLPDALARDKVVRLFPDTAAESDNVLLLKQQFYRDIVREKGVKLAYPGVHDRLAALQAKGIGLAVGTNSIMLNTTTCLDAAGLARFFPVVVTLDRVANGKPAPDIYQEAARQLGIHPTRCAVFEDSPAGASAARAAGCVVVGLANSVPLHDLPALDQGFQTTAEALDWVLSLDATARTA